MMNELWTTWNIFVSSCYAKTWYPWLEHIRLVFQCSHVVIYALQLCHFYEYNHFHNYKILHKYRHFFFKLLCMPLTLFHQIFSKLKTLMGGASHLQMKNFCSQSKNIMHYILYVVIWMQLVLQCIIKF